MNFFKLKIFVTVCKTKNFTKAAEQLFITQSAVSKSIKDLESTWELKLIHRQGNQITITPIGESLLGNILNLINDYSLLENAINTLKTHTYKKIRLGSGSSITKSALESITRYLSEKFPETELEIHAGNSSSTESLLKNGEIDYGIVASETLAPELVYVPIATDIIWPVCHLDHVFAGKTISAKELLTQNLFAREKGSATQETVNKYFQDNGLLFPVTNSFNYNESLLSYFIIEKGQIGFISETEIAQKLLWKNIGKITLKEGGIHRQIYLAYRKANYDPMFLKDIGMAIKSMKKSWGRQK
ncbi:LysR family transcriptional regulator [uncultured Chryseobacterium sp.]|uniref:LysR family transcriptional regulator n=1 Tax=uncultured Chryseobacterium sp. TaxID=259322 RepID=UPI0025EDD056|nr:LysR family transcriptional regulator [uncultured Chryseobacterium sp.]